VRASGRRDREVCESGWYGSHAHAPVHVPEEACFEAREFGRSYSECLSETAIGPKGIAVHFAGNTQTDREKPVHHMKSDRLHICLVPVGKSCGDVHGGVLDQGAGIMYELDKLDERELEGLHCMVDGRRLAVA
jgi:hypothetical protein